MPDPDLISITSSNLTARINPLGAELWSLTDRQGREYMTDADPAFWTGHAPILFPIVGMLNGGHYRLCGSAHELAKHGFARHSRFEIVEASNDSATFRLTSSEATRLAYPFAFTLDIGFRLESTTLLMTATVANHGATDMPFSFGFHPAFAWPLPGGGAKDDHRITFAEPEPQPIRRVDPATGLLLPDAQATPIVGREFTPDAALFAADALIWDRLNSRSLTFGAEGGASLAIDFPDTPMLGIWQKPGANYLCIEPWQGIADPAGFTGDLRDKPGVVKLAADESRSFRMDVTVTPPPSRPS